MMLSKMHACAVAVESIDGDLSTRQRRIRPNLEDDATEFERIGASAKATLVKAHAPMNDKSSVAFIFSSTPEFDYCKRLASYFFIVRRTVEVKKSTDSWACFGLYSREWT